MVIDGKQIAQKVLSQLKKEIEDKKLKLQMAAVLACPEGVEGLALKKFVELKEKAAEKIGINFKIFQFDKNISQPVMIHHNTKLSEEFDGVLVELPLPPHLNQQEILNAIPVEKDVDVLSTKAQELFYTNRSLIMPPSAEALGLLFENMNLNPEGKTVALFGYGLLIGKPIAHWLEQKGARISVIRSKTENPSEISRKADIIISGVGKPGLINGDMVKDGVVAIDFGYGKDVNGRMRGDIDFDSVVAKASLITPVPGGMGPILIAAVLKNLILLNS